MTPMIKMRRFGASSSLLLLDIPAAVNHLHSTNSSTSSSGFSDFQTRYPDLCEGQAIHAGELDPSSCPIGRFAFTSLSQPCLPVCNQGPTKVLPFVYLGSLQDAMDQESLEKHGIGYVLNMSVACPKPDFIQDEHFLRIPVNDNCSEKLLPHFEKAFDFLNKVNEANGVVLVHCLAGISRSPTLIIAYVMSYLRMTQEEAYRYVKEKRPSISPNFNFLGQLLEYEKQLKSQRNRLLFAEQKVSLLSQHHHSLLRSPLVVVAESGGRPTRTGGVTFETGLLDSDRLSPPNNAAADNFKRSLSCPMKIQKNNVATKESPEDPVVDCSPANKININGKRQMEPKSVLVQKCSSVSKPARTACGWSTSLRRLNTVEEDAPSPSVQLSKLTTDDREEDETQANNEENSCTGSKIENPFSAAFSAVAANEHQKECPMIVEQKDDCPSTVVDEKECPMVEDDFIEVFGVESPPSSLPHVVPTPTEIRSGLFNEFKSRFGVRTLTCSKSTDNCRAVDVLNVRTCSPSAPMTFCGGGGSFPNLVSAVAEPQKNLLLTSLSKRFRHLLNGNAKRASWCAPYEPLQEPPIKSKSTTCGAATTYLPDLDSPESGFHERGLMSDASSSSTSSGASLRRSDADRDSLGSTSSLEIIVN